MTRKNPDSRSSKKVLAYDLGGTKVHVGIVTASGKILEELRVPVVTAQGKNAVIAQLAELGKDFLAKHPNVQEVGLASAGPLDPVRGLLLDPTNLAGPDGHWGKVPIARQIGRAHV